MNDERPVYVSYLLRLWSVRVDHETEWRASLESSLTGERLGFASLDELLDFLRRETGQCADQTRVESDDAGDEAP